MSNEIRLIDANIKPEDYVAVWEVDLPEYGKQRVMAIDDLLCLPTVDAVPVRQGEWRICCDGYYPYCSRCNNEPQGRVMTRFCPNCGAKMDGGEDIF